MARKPHPHLERLRKLTATFPEASEVETWDHPTFRAGKKIFATYGEGEDGPQISVKQTRENQAILVEDEDGRFFVPAYVGHKGWVGIRCRKTKWAVVADLVEESYRMIALKRMVKALDEQRGKS